jgi:hypothetical protein
VLRVVEPEGELAAALRRRRRVYTRAYEGLREVFPALS